MLRRARFQAFFVGCYACSLVCISQSFAQEEGAEKKVTHPVYRIGLNNSNNTTIAGTETATDADAEG